MRRAVVTGMGCVTSLGNKPTELLSALGGKKSGISRIEKINTEGYNCQFGGEIKKFSLRELNVAGTNMMLRYNQLELYSVLKALSDYEWLLDSKEDKLNCSIYSSSQIINIDLETLEIILSTCWNEDTAEIEFSKISDSLQRMPPLNGVKLLPTIPSHFISKSYDAHGPGNVIFGGESSSLLAVLLAARDIENGRIDKAIVASSFSPFTEHEFYWLSQLDITKRTSNTDDPSKLAFPFDYRHSGIIFGEGAGTLLIESEDSARKHGRKILARIDGGSSGIYPGTTFFSLSNKGFQENMCTSLKKYSLTPNDIDLIFANAPSQPEWDKEELLAIDRLWSDLDVKIVSTKGYYGFLNGTAGIVDCIVAIQSMIESEVLSTLNFESVDCTIQGNFDKYFLNKNEINRCLINSAGFGGNYSSIIIERGEFGQ